MQRGHVLNVNALQTVEVAGGAQGGKWRVRRQVHIC